MLVAYTSVFVGWFSISLLAFCWSSCTLDLTRIYIFFQQQVAKEAAVEAAEKEVYEAILNNCLEDLLEAIKRYETALAALENFRKVLV
jgi:hypothetical protein